MQIISRKYFYLRDKKCILNRECLPCGTQYVGAEYRIRQLSFPNVPIKISFDKV